MSTFKLKGKRVLLNKPEINDLGLELSLETKEQLMQDEMKKYTHLEVFAIGDTCSHSDASLAEGDITDFKIECWLHGAEFDLRTGKALTPPATAPVHKYSVSVDGDSVTIEK
jgi:nitrite reductase/ring-hydroxylating ferredoxin subunit